MKHVALMFGVPLLMAGCSAELLSFLDPPSSPKPKTGDDCYVAVVRPAPMFYLDAPHVAAAGATISLEPWVLRSAPIAKIDEILLPTFEAKVDLVNQRVTLVGSIERYEANPEADCAFPAIYMVPQAATLSVPVVLPAGTYEVAIASDSFITEQPPAIPYEPNRVYPGPQATRSLRVE